MMPDGLEIEVVYHDACPHLMDAACELAKAFSELDYRGEVRVLHRCVTSPEEAHEFGFAGWPVLRVNGRGVTPEACPREPPRWAACHHYSAAEGAQHFPQAHEIRLVIQEVINEMANT